MRRFANGITLGTGLALIAAAPCPAGGLAVSVLDASGRGVEDAVVVVAPLDAKSAPAANPAPAIMDQRSLAFLPRILIIAVGTSVEFPNNDTVSHQVYSFSRAKKFQLPLYKGERHPPVRFDQEGLIVLGCNIHDEMVGYIYVTRAPYFGKTGAGGRLELENLPAGDYRVTVWSPFITDEPSTLTRTVHVDARDSVAEQLKLARALRARPEPRPHRSDWEY